MTDNAIVFLFRTIMISESRYAVTLFRSCQNLLLYPTLHFLLILTTKTTVPRYTTQILGIRISLRNSG